MPPEPSQPSVPRFRQLRRGPWLQFRFPWDFEINQLDLPIAGLPPALEGLRILHLTDLHFRAGWARPFDELIDGVAADPPDLILFTGDLVEHHYDPRPAFESAGRLVTALQSRHGKYAILGNHDGDLLGPMLLGWGLHLINGGLECLTIHHTPIELIGLPGVHREDLTARFISRLPPPAPDSPSGHRATLRIILSHYPDALPQIAHLRPDLVLAGHTHGGQVCLPGGIPILTHDSLPRRTCKGIHRIHDTWLLVGKGFGFSTWPFRTFCPAEIIEITLAAK